jgi:hypothetical protein
MRSNGTWISSNAQITFCTFDDVLRPQTFNMFFPSPIVLRNRGAIAPRH